MEGDVKVPHTCVLLNGHGGSNSYGCKVKLDFIHILLLFNIFICVLLFLSQPVRKQLHFLSISDTTTQHVF